MAICINVGIQFATMCLTTLAVGPVRYVFGKSRRIELDPLGLQYIHRPLSELPYITGTDPKHLRD
jgi:hypothetical protein